MIYCNPALGDAKLRIMPLLFLQTIVHVFSNRVFEILLTHHVGATGLVIVVLRLEGREAQRPKCNILKSADTMLDDIAFGQLGNLFRTRLQIHPKCIRHRSLTQKRLQVQDEAKIFPTHLVISRQGPAKYSGRWPPRWPQDPSEGPKDKFWTDCD